MRERDDVDPQLVLGAIATGCVLLVVAWVVPAVVVAVWKSQTPRCSPAAAIAGSVRVVSDGRWSNPASAYPPRVRAQMPDARRWWITTGAFALLLVGAGGVVWRRLEPQISRERLGRRPYDWRGARPRSWARRRDLSPLASRCSPASGCFSLGTIDGRRLQSEPESHVAVVAPTRSGKTTRYVIPWLLEHDGPAIVTSTKRDVLDATRRWRQRRGGVWVFDPFGADSAAWDPLEGCDDWSYALRQAHWLADATQDGDSEVAAYWRGEAAKLLAPLMHAAALEERSVGDVIAWLDTQEAKEPTRILKASRLETAAKQLQSVVSLDPRNRGTTFMSAGSVLAAYRFPQVLETARTGLKPELFLDGAPHTLYVVASERDQRLLAPLIVALLSSLLNEAGEHATAHGPLRRTLRVLVDEAANVAPLRELPRFLSQAAAHGIRIATIWQSLGQMRERYGPASDTILANSTAKLFMGPITDDATRRYVVDLLGDEYSENDPRGRRKVSKARAGALQQLAGDRALLVAGSAPPAVVRTRGWWDERRLRRRGARRQRR